MSIILRDGTNAGNVAAIDSDGSLHVTGSISATNPSVSPTGAAVPADATLVGGTEGGNLVPLALDGSGNLLVNVAAGSSGNSAASPTGSAVPANADYIGINVAGNLVGVSASNPLPITGSISTTNPSVSATGSVVPADATMVGGTDGTDLRALLTDATGQLKVLVENSPAVSGTVTAEIVGNSGATLDAAPGTAIPANGLMVGGSDGTNFRAILTDNTGQAKVLVQNFPSTQPVSGTVTSNQGTANTAANSWPVEITDGTNILGTPSHPVRVDPTGTTTQPVSGTVTADIVGHSGAILDAVLGAAIPPNAVLVGGSDGTNLRAILTDNTGQAKVLLENAIPAGTNVIGHVITDTGSTTAVTGNVTVVQPTGTNLHTVLDSGTVTANAGTGSFTVAQATAANLNATVVGTLTHNNAAPAANNIGALVGVASAANPTYTTGDQVLLSTDLSGNLRVAGSLTVSDADTVGTPGTLNANNTTATVTTTGQGGVGVLIAAGTLAATVVPEVSYDGGTTWVASIFFDPTANTTSANLVFTNPNSATMRTILIEGGVSNARVRVSAFTSGTATATLRSTFNAGGQYVNQGGAWSVSIPGTVAVTQSTSPWVVSGTVTANAGTGSFTVAQATAANLNATVVGTGTFPVQAQQSGNWTTRTVGNTGAVLDAAPGVAAPANAVQVGGTDGTNLRAILTDSTGQAKVLVQNFPSTQPVSGTVTANAGTGSFTVAQATAANLNATVVGTGTFPVQAQQSGTWTVQQGGAPWSQNLTQVAGTALGATAVTNFGTAPAAAAVPGVNASVFAGTTGITATGSSLNANVTNTVPVTLTSTTITGSVTVAQATAANLNATVVGTGTFAVQAAQSGNWTTRTVGNTGAVLDAAPGVAAPANAVQVGGTDGTNLRAFSTDTSGNLNVNVKSTPTGTTTGSAVPATVTYEGINVAGTLRGATGVNPSGTVYAQQTDTTSVAGTTVSTAAAGVQKVGIVGNAGGAVDAATAATAPANAVQVGAVAATSYPTAVTNGQLVGAMSDKAGRLVVVHSGPRDIITPISYQSTSATSATIISSQGAGIFTDILWALFTNESSTATIVSLSDGTITYKIAIASNGGAMLPIPVPLKASSANAAWQISNSAAVNVDVILQYVSNK